MKKLDLGQTLSILANVGVIAGIIFLGIELRQNNDQLAAQSRFNNYQGRIAAFIDWATDEEFAALYVKAVEDPASLTPVEFARVSIYLSGVLSTWEYELGEYQRGRITDAEFNVERKRAVYAGQKTIYDAVWPEYRVTAPAAFVQFVEQQIF